MENKYKLSPMRLDLVKNILEYLQDDSIYWKKGWGINKPCSAITNKPYRGVNGIYLSTVAKREGYVDPRWVTYNQMKREGWKFKKDKQGVPLAKNKGVTIEFFSLVEKDTGKAFDKSILNGLSEDEARIYLEENVKAIRRNYVVFNGELIDGISKYQAATYDNKVNQYAEDLIRYWNDNECKINIGYSESFYNIKKDEIFVPAKESFTKAEDYYGTIFHEMVHSTGHSKRLNRKIDNAYDSKEYAIEELHAQFGELMLEREIGLEVSKEHLKNESAYIKGWISAIKEDPKILIDVITNADRISHFILSRAKEIAPVRYTIAEDIDGYYALKLEPDGSVNRVSKEIHVTEEEANEEVKRIYKDKQLIKTTKEDIFNRSTQSKNIAWEKRIEMNPYKILTKEDKEVIFNCRHSKFADSFIQLFNNQRVYENRTKNLYALFLRTSVFADSPEQVYRVYAKSKMYSEKQNKETLMPFIQKAFDQTANLRAKKETLLFLDQNEEQKENVNTTKSQDIAETTNTENNTEIKESENKEANNKTNGYPTTEKKSGRTK